jgi:Putative peptidoglycan binding domain
MMMKLMGFLWGILSLAVAVEAQTRVPVVVAPQLPAISASRAPVQIDVPRVNVSPIVQPPYYVGYPYGYVPYNQRVFYPPFRPDSAAALPPVVPITRVPNSLALGANNPSPRFSSQRGSRFNFQYSNELVRSLQSELRRHGYYSGAVDGILGPATQTALQQFQVDRRQSPTGLIDQPTLSALGIIR